MEPLSWLANAVITIVLPKILEKTSEKIGDAVIEKSDETVQLVCKIVQDKLQSAGTTGLLKRAEEKPTEHNIQVLEGELVSQMEEDKEFAAQLEALIEALIQQTQVQSPTLQAVLDTVRVKGNAKIGNVEQVNESRAAEQVIGRNLGVKGDFEIGDITQMIQRKQ